VLPLLLSIAFAAVVAAPPAGVVTTVAGTPGAAGYWDGPAPDAMFAHPTWIEVVGNDIFVIDRINQKIRRIAPNGDVSTLATSRQFPNEPFPIDFGSAFGGGIVFEPAGCGGGIYGAGMFVAGSGQEQIILVSMNGQLGSRDAYPVRVGTGESGSRDSDMFEAQFRTPVGVAIAARAGHDPFEVLFIADSGNHTIRRADYIYSPEDCPLPWYVTTLAGVAGQPGSADGARGAARFNTPRGLAALPDGTLFVTDAGNHTIRKITPDGTVTTIAGVPGVAGSDDGPALQAHLDTPSGIDVNDKGELFIADTFNHTIRKLAGGVLTTIAGRPGVSGFADGDAAAAMFNAPVGLKVAPDGSIVIADTGNNVIRRFSVHTP
jgi:hypothetical protein